MSSWPVFLTAPSVAPKVLNKAWILLQDFEFTDPDDDGSWILLTSTTLPETAHKPTRQLATLDPIPDHDLADATMDDIGNFVRTNEAQLQKLNITTFTWIVIDQKGLESSTCILARRKYDPEKRAMTHEFDAIRIPFTEAWIMFANLDVGNMGFEDWADTDGGLQDDDTYKWRGPFPHTNEAQLQAQRDTEAKREKHLKIAKDLGHIE